jgi:hypothetical protein
MPQLATGFLAALLAQAPRLASQSVARGRFAAVVAILRLSRFQLTQALEQRGDLLALLCHDGFEFGDAGFWCHAPILRLLRKSG